MPTYQYQCDACAYAFEMLQSMLDKKLKKCPQCGKNKLQRLIGAGSGIIFKGSGFYETDYKKKDAPVQKTTSPSQPVGGTAPNAQPQKCADVPKKTEKQEVGQAS